MTYFASLMEKPFCFYDNYAMHLIHPQKFERFPRRNNTTSITHLCVFSFIWIPYGNNIIFFILAFLESY